MSFLNNSLEFVLLAFILLATVLGASAYGRRRRRLLVARIIGNTQRVSAMTDASVRKRRIRHVLLLVGMALAILALARPWWGRRVVTAPDRARDVIVAIDCSRSMLAQDTPPSRMEHAKWLVRALIERSAGDRFGLIAFAGDAFLECPLTRDRNTLFTFLNDLDTRTIPVGGTNIAKALEIASDAFKAAEGGDRAVVLVSDGDELQGNVLAETDKLKVEDIPLFVVGIGDPSTGSMIRLADGSYLRDAAGELVSTKLDEQKMRELARITGGIYLRSTAVAPNTDALTARVKALIPEQREMQTRLQPIERYQIPLAIAVVCLVVRLLIGDRRNHPLKLRPGVTAMLVLLLAPTLTATTGPTPAPAIGPLEAPKSDKLAKQAQSVETELADAPLADQARLHYNLGVLYQRMGDPKTATEHYRQALSHTDSERLAGLTQWNLGTVKHLQGLETMTKNPEEALRTFAEAGEAYRNAMHRFPGNSGLGTNQELLLRDQDVAEQLKKLRDMQKKAANQTKAARDQQDQTNDAPSEQQEDLQRQAAEKTREATASTQALNDHLKKLGAKTDADTEQEGQQPNPIEQAVEQLENATSAQQKAQQMARNETERQRAREEALDSLDKALAALGEPKQQQQEQDGEPPDNSQQVDGQQQNDGDSQQQSAQQDPMQQLANQMDNEADNASPSQPQEMEGKYAEAQAEAILRRMLEDEQDLRDALKEYQRRQYRDQETEKNW